MKIVLWLVAPILILILLKFLYLVVKRTVLILKIKAVKGCKVHFVRNRYASVFSHSGKTDFELVCDGKKYAVSILTTPFRRVRYHFTEDGKLELIKERRAVYAMSPHHPRPQMGATVDNAFTIRKYRIQNLNTPVTEAEGYIILHPAPRIVSKISGTQLTALQDNDLLFGGKRICGLNYFLNRVTKS